MRVWSRDLSASPTLSPADRIDETNTALDLGGGRQQTAATATWRDRKGREGIVIDLDPARPRHEHLPARLP
jgi:hypothetical protein